jgi:hypothetical protein
VVGGCFIAARSTSLGVLQRAHWISSQGKPPSPAWSMVGDGGPGSQLSICLGVSMRQLAGRSVIPELEQEENGCRVRSGSKVQEKRSFCRDEVCLSETCIHFWDNSGGPW